MVTDTFLMNPLLILHNFLNVGDYIFGLYACCVCPSVCRSVYVQNSWKISRWISTGVSFLAESEQWPVLLSRVQSLVQCRLIVLNRDHII